MANFRFADDASRMCVARTGNRAPWKGSHCNFCPVKLGECEALEGLVERNLDLFEFSGPSLRTGLSNK